MNAYLIIAAVLLTVVGIVHSLLGEKLIFSKLRSAGLVPTLAPQPLQQRHIRIIWATWHIVSLLGFGIGGFLYCIALPNNTLDFNFVMKSAIALPLLLSALLVLVATKAKHPGWVGLLAVSLLVFGS